MDKISCTSETQVQKENTAEFVGSGTLPVFATPSMAALMENAAMKAAEKLLSEGETTVGSELNIKHLSPSPIGANIKATATLLQQEGRKLTFSVLATEDDKTIGEGIHIRYIINIQKFMQKLGLSI